MTARRSLLALRMIKSPKPWHGTSAIGDPVSSNKLGYSRDEKRRESIYYSKTDYGRDSGTAVPVASEARRVG